MDKTFPEAINGIRSAVMASEVREDIAQGMEYVEQFANTATTKAEEAAASAEAAAKSAENVSTAVSAAIDPTLSVSGKAADAKATGDAIQGVRDDLTTEISRAKAAEEQNATDISAESARAKEAESALSTKIEEETTRAKAAEKANADNLTTESERATGEEQRLDTAITDEKTRAEQAEQALSARTDALESCGFVVVNGKVCIRYMKKS